MESGKSLTGTGADKRTSVINKKTIKK